MISRLMSMAFVAGLVCVAGSVAKAQNPIITYGTPVVVHQRPIQTVVRQPTAYYSYSVAASTIQRVTYAQPLQVHTPVQYQRYVPQQRSGTQQRYVPRQRFVPRISSRRFSRSWREPRIDAEDVFEAIWDIFD